MSTPKPSASPSASGPLNPGTIGAINAGTASPTSTPSPSAGDAPPVPTLPGDDSTDTNPFGLGALGTQSVNPGGLGLATVLAGSKATGNSILSAFAKAGQSQGSTLGTLYVSQIQQALYFGGFYGSNTNQPTYGVVSPADVSALSKAVKLAAQSGQSVSQVLLTHAQVGVATGIASAAQATKAGHATITLPNTQDLEAVAVKAFQEELGRKATPGEAAAFAASYRAMSAGMQRAQNQAAYDAQNNTGLSPSQEQALEGQVQQAGTNAPTTPINAGNSRLNDELNVAQDTPVDPNNQGQFNRELGSLADIANQTRMDATPQITGGLTQTTQDSPESAATAAENYAQNTNPQQADAKSIAGQFDSFLQILGTNFGGGSA